MEKVMKQLEQTVDVHGKVGVLLTLPPLRGPKSKPSQLRR